MNATKPAEPTINAVVVAGIFDHNPPISVRSWVFVVKMTEPALMKIRDLAIAWVNNNKRAIST